MVGLIDIAPASERVPVQGAKIEVFGVSAAGVAHLLSRFPELRRLITGRDVTEERLFAIGGDCVAAIIAAGCGYPGDAEQEAAAARLGIHDQAALLGPILRLTMPKGVGPFVETLAGLMGALGVNIAPPEKAPATKSRKRSAG